MSEPLNMILPCPRCKTLHIDAPEPDKKWTNPPHKSHLCHNEECVDEKGERTVWRPADVPTNGVAKIETRGKKDNWWTEKCYGCDQIKYVAGEFCDDCIEAWKEEGREMVY